MSHSKSILGILTFVFLITSSVSADMAEDSKIIGVSGGENHTLVLTKNNIPWACGTNGDVGFYGVLGTGNDDYHFNELCLVPVHDGDMNTPSTYLEGITNIAAGWQHSMALDVNRHVWAWGGNVYGELGDNQQCGENSTVPVQVRGPNNVGYLDGIVAISLGRSGTHSLAIDVNGNARSWGANDRGQLGIGYSSQQSHKNTPVVVLAGEQEPNNPNIPLKYVSKISGGAKFSVAVDSNGYVFSWGSNTLRNGYGCLGNGSTNDHNDRPVRVNAGEQNPVDPCSPLKNIVSVSAGWEHTLSLERLNSGDANCRGRVYAWGNNNEVHPSGGGQLGDNTTDSRDRPVVVHAGEQNPSNPDSNLEGIIAVSAGDGHSIALDINGYVWAWGSVYYNYGQLGNGSTIGNKRPVKVLRFDGQPLSGITTISAGYWHNLAVDVNGILWSWGFGGAGRLGLGDTEDKHWAYPRPPVLNITKESFNYKNIQTNIDEANNGDVLELVPAIYFEWNIDFGTKSLTLKSTDPCDWNIVEKTVIQGTGYVGSEIPILKFFDNSGSMVSGLTLLNSDIAVRTDYSSPLIERCIITNCDMNGLYIRDFSAPEITNCKIYNNSYMAGILINNASANINNNWIYDNNIAGIIAGYSTGDSYFTNNRIYGNNGYGIAVNQSSASSTVNISNNMIYNNGYYGMSIYMNSGDVNIANNMIYDNDYGMYISTSTGPMTIRNNTVVKNGYGIYRDGGSERIIYSSIVYGNSSGNLSNGCYGYYSWTSGLPHFVDYDANDFHIDPNSPCKDAGDPDFTDSSDTDIDGEPRIYNGRVDIGADELSWPKEDFDHNDIVNFNDYARWAKYWMGNDPNGRLDSDNDVDIYDLDIFCDYWLWTAPWSPLHQSLGLDDMGMMSDNSVEQSESTGLGIQPSDNEQQSTLLDEGATPAVWLVYDGNTMPAYGDEITVYIHSDANLMIMDVIAEVVGDAEITSAMNESDCNNYGWDNGWGSDPYIDPAGWVEIFGISPSAFFEGKIINGTVSYFKFRYYTGQVSVSITDGCLVDNNIEGVPFSTDFLFFGPDPNQ